MGSETQITRRAMLALAGSGVAVAMLPVLPKSISVSASKVPLPAWAVGTPGETDWLHIVARSANEARRAWVNEHFGGDGCEVVESIADAGGLEAYLADGGEPPTSPCDCEWCVNFAGAEARRIPPWDGKQEITSSADWLQTGLGSICDRCGYECSTREGTGHVVKCEAVCEDCMTINDWHIVNPEHAAELEAEREDRALAQAQRAAKDEGGEQDGV